MKRFDSGSPAPAFDRPAVRGTRYRFAVVVGLALALAGCSSSAPSFTSSGSTLDSKWGVSSSKRVIATGPIPKGGGYYKLGKPYQIGGRWYVPRHEPYYDRSGVGSWYGQDFHGRKTANGEIFDMDALTAAHPTLPMPSYAYVTNMRNGRTILVRINDRGPYVADREIDLSRASARAIGYAGAGLSKVRVRWAGHAPLDGNDRREQEFLRNQPWNGGPGYDMSNGGDERQPPRSYRPQPQPRRYAEDHNRQVDAYDNSGYPAPTAYEDRNYPQPGSGRSDSGMSGDAYRPPRAESGYEDGYGVAQPESSARYAPRQAYDDQAPGPSRYVEPAEQMAPATNDLWSPFDHREQVKSVKRK